MSSPDTETVEAPDISQSLASRVEQLTIAKNAGNMTMPNDDKQNTNDSSLYQYSKLEPRQLRLFDLQPGIESVQGSIYVVSLDNSDLTYECLCYSHVEDVAPGTGSSTILISGRILSVSKTLESALR